MRKLTMFEKPILIMLAPDGAGAGAPAGGDGSGDAGASGTGTNSGAGDGSGQGENKTFTQEDINRIAAKEKAEGRRALLKELGIEDTEDSRNAIKAFLAQQESQKSDLQKANERASKAEKAKADAEATALAIQRKYDALSAGAKADTIDDLMALASTKVNDKTDFKAALEQVKKAYPVFFNEASQTGTVGTGRSTNPARNTNGHQMSMGERLAKSRMGNSQAENPFFKKSF